MKRRKVFLFFSFLLICVVHSSAQRGRNWYMSQAVALKSNDTGATAINNGYGGLFTDFRSIATMSDTAGSLLFYSDAARVINRNHIPMPNGGYILNSFPFDSRTCLTLPLPGSDSLYYLFNPRCGTPYFPGGFYHLIDISLDGGLGDVSSGPTLFSTMPLAMCITAIGHANGRDYWVVVCDYNDPRIFYSYLLSPTGIAATPVVSNFTAAMAPIAIGYDGFFQLKPSPDGTLLARSLNGHTTGYFQLLKFNPATGQLSQPLDIPIGTNYGGLCFSPNGRRLYVGGPQPLCYVHQFSVASYNAAAIIASSYPFATRGRICSDMANGLDNRMLLDFGSTIANVGGNPNNWLGRIENPNDSGPALQYRDSVLRLFPGNSTGYFPNFPNNINRYLYYVIPAITGTGCHSYRFRFAHNLRGATTQHWQFGDGSSSTDTVATHTYSFSADSVLVTLTVSNTDTSITRQQWLHLPRRPVATFSFATQGCGRDTVGFSGSIGPAGGTLPDSLRWTLGDGSTVQGLQHFPHLYPDTGRYTVQLWATDTLGCRSDTATRVVVLNKKLVARFGLAGPACNNAPLLLADSAVAYSTTITRWWYGLSTGDSAVSTTSGNLIFSALPPGSYTLRQAVRSPEGCRSDTATRLFTVYAKPAARFGLPQNCVLDRSWFTDSSTAAPGSSIAGWKWRFGDATATPANPDSAMQQHPTHQYGSAGLYTIRLVATDDKSCTDTLTRLFTVNGAVPQAHLSLLPGQLFCSGDSIAVADVSTVDFGSLTRLMLYWSNTDSIVSNAPAAGSVYTHRYPAFGTPVSQQQAVRLRVQSGAACSATLDTVITLYGKPQVQLLPIAPVCQNGEALLLSGGSITNGAIATTAYSGSGVRYNGAILQYQLLPGSLPPGNSTIVRYHATTTQGCADSAGQTVQVAPAPTADAGPDKTLPEGATTLLLATASGNALQYRWQPATGLSNAAVLQPTAIAASDVVYYLTVSTGAGCTATDSMHLSVLKNLLVPNAFSPNGDGVNDTWAIPYLSSYSGATVEVYDRYGSRVFYSRGYTTPWDGTVNSRPLPVGTYYYRIAPGSGRQPLSGSVTLVR